MYAAADRTAFNNIKGAGKLQYIMIFFGTPRYLFYRKNKLNKLMYAAADRTAFNNIKGAGKLQYIMIFFGTPRYLFYRKNKLNK